MLCARLESVASMLEARSAAVGEAQLRAILHEHQSALEAQQLAQDLPISPHISPISPHISLYLACSSEARRALSLRTRAPSSDAAC